VIVRVCVVTQCYVKSGLEIASSWVFPCHIFLSVYISPFDNMYDDSLVE
jgi:hypothetical protein